MAHEVGPTGGTGTVESLKTSVESARGGARATRGNARLAVQIRVRYLMESDIPIRQPCGARTVILSHPSSKNKKIGVPKLYKCLFFSE